MRSFSALLLALAMLPAIAAAAWMWVEIFKAAEDLGSLGNFEGINFDE